MIEQEPQTNTNQVRYRQVPSSQLDFYKQITDPVWGKDNEINQDLQNKLTKYFNIYDGAGNLKRDSKTGKALVTKDNMWGLLNFFTRDMRLANLNKEELVYCTYYLDLAGDLLNVDQVEPFTICLERAGSVLELSQSKSGFYRKQLHTFTQENVYQERDPPKKSLMGMGGSKRGD